MNSTHGMLSAAIAGQIVGTYRYGVPREFRPSKYRSGYATWLAPAPHRLRSPFDDCVYELHVLVLSTVCVLHGLRFILAP